MPTGYEVHMYADISNMAQSLNRIANCLEAAEKRARKVEEDRLHDALEDLAESQER